RLGEMGEPDLRRAAARERRRSGEALEEHAPERVDVALPRRLPALDQLWREVVRRAEELALGGQPRRVRAARQPEVRQSRSSLAERLVEPVPADHLPRSGELAHGRIMIRFRLLGPVEAPAKLPGGKPTALLARLLLEPGRVVPVDTLVDDLWRDPPASAHKVVQVYVSQLRKALGADAIETK